MLLSQVLDYCADHIELVGLHKGGMFPKAVAGSREDQALAPCCAIGAIHVIVCGGPAAREAGGLFSRAAGKLGATIGEMVGGWNDAPERTQADVIAAFREAARRARITEV